MANTEQILRLKLENKLKEDFSAAKLSNAVRKVAEEVITMNRNKLNAGLDRNGKRIKQLSADYSLFKRRYASGNLRHRAKRKGFVMNYTGAAKAAGKAWYKNLYDFTEFMAKGTPNFGRLTGQFFSDMSIQVIQKADFKLGKIYITLRYYVKPRSKKKIEGLVKKGRDYFGLADANTNQGLKEKQRIFAVLGKLLNLNMSKSSVKAA